VRKNLTLTILQLLKLQGISLSTVLMLMTVILTSIGWDRIHFAEACIGTRIFSS